MADSLRFGAFELYRSGVAEVAKSAGVSSELARLASSMAAKANAEATTRISDEDSVFYKHGHAVERKAPYESEVKSVNFTAIGIVSTTGEQGMRDQSLHHTLDSLNH